jgi:hypothetical protein
MAAQALDHYRHALAELDQLGRAEDASTISLLNNYAGALGVAGQPQAALDAMLQVKARMLQGDPGVRLPAYLLSNIALMLNAVGRYDDALAATTDSDFIAAAAQDPNAALYRQVAHARALAEMGRFDEAHREFQALEAALEKTPGLGRSRGPFLYALARLEFLQGHAALARDHLMKLLAVKGQPPEVILSAQQLQPEIDLALGLPEQAEDEARAVLAEAMKPLSAGALSVWVGRGALVLGKVQAARAKWADARRSLSTAVQHLEHTLAATAPALLEARARLKLLDDKG